MTAHSTIGPSSADRWFNCPGSVALCATLPAAPASKYAAEGTLAHTLAEELVTGKTNTLALYERIGDVVKVDGYDIEITEEMVSAAEEYRDAVAETLAAVKATGKKDVPIVSKTEVRLSGKAVDERLFGTADHILYQIGNELHVFDFKFGKGLAVEADDNKQLSTYAAMAMDGEVGWEFERVFLHIFQPRAKHAEGGWRVWQTTPGFLSVFKGELAKAVKATAQPNAPLAAGDWCRWCAAKASCPAIYGAMVKEAQVDFAVVPTGPSAAAALPSIDVLPIEQIARALAWKDTFESWFKAAEERAQRELEAGRSVPGYKLVPGRSNRQWRDEAEVVAKFEPVLGDKVYEEPKVKSPAALEKLVGKKAGVDDLTFKPEAPLRLAKDSDPRSAETIASAAAKAFDPIEGGTIRTSTGSEFAVGNYNEKDRARGGPNVFAPAEPKKEVSLEEELGLAPRTKTLWPA